MNSRRNREALEQCKGSERSSRLEGLTDLHSMKPSLEFVLALIHRRKRNNKEGQDGKERGILFFLPSLSCSFWKSQ